MLIILLTGLSGAGKSTLANALVNRLKANNFPVALIDGDQYRQTINKDLGFSEEDRRENIRRLMKLANEKKQAGLVTVVAAINPFDDQRREQALSTGSIVVYIKCSLEILVQRDPKGLYKRALLPDTDPRKLYNLTGVNDRYDEPAAPHLVVDTGVLSVEMATDRLVTFVLIQLAVL